MLELEEERVRKGSLFSVLVHWISSLSPQGDVVAIYSQTIQYRLNKLKEKRAHILKNAKMCKETLPIFLKEEFLIPKHRTVALNNNDFPSSDIPNSSLNDSSDSSLNYSDLFPAIHINIDSLLTENQALEEKIQHLCECLAEENSDRISYQLSLIQARKDITKYKSEREQLHLKLDDKISKLSRLNPRNVTKRMDRQKLKNEHLQVSLSNVSSKNEDMEGVISDLNLKLDCALKQGLSAYVFLLKKICH